MPALKNMRHELFCQGLVSGLSQTRAYIAAGYSERGAKQSAARLLNNPNVRSRLAELRAENLAQYLQLVDLMVTDREQRLLAIQDRWERVRRAIICRANDDYEGMMRTGMVRRKRRMIGSGPLAREVVEYEIDNSAIEALNSIEKRAAIETGQEQENINVSGQVTSKAIALSKVMTIPELEELERKMLAEMEKEKASGKVIEAPKSST